MCRSMNRLSILVSMQFFANYRITLTAHIAKRNNLRSWTPSVGNQWLQTKKEGDTGQTRFLTEEHVESDQDTHTDTFRFLAHRYFCISKYFCISNGTKINGQISWGHGPGWSTSDILLQRGGYVLVTHVINTEEYLEIFRGDQIIVVSQQFCSIFGNQFLSLIFQKQSSLPIPQCTEDNAMNVNVTSYVLSVVCGTKGRKNPLFLGPQGTKGMIRVGNVKNTVMLFQIKHPTRRRSRLGD